MISTGRIYSVLVAYDLLFGETLALYSLYKLFTLTKGGQIVYTSRTITVFILYS